MDRKSYIQLLYKIYNNTTSFDEIEVLYRQYCIDKGKAMDNFDMLFTYFKSENLIPETLQYPIDYYNNKYNIIILYDKPNILNSVASTKKVLLII